MKLARFDLAKLPAPGSSGEEEVECDLDKLGSRWSICLAVPFPGLPTSNAQGSQVIAVVPQEGPPPKPDSFIHHLKSIY